MTSQRLSHGFRRIGALVVRQSHLQRSGVAGRSASGLIAADEQVSPVPVEEGGGATFRLSPVQSMLTEVFSGQCDSGVQAPCRDFELSSAAVEPHAKALKDAERAPTRRGRCGRGRAGVIYPD